MLSGIIFTMLFLANTLTSCIKMAKVLVEFCRGNDEVGPRFDKHYPATHIVPLKKLTDFAAIQSLMLTFSPLMNTFAAPLVIGQLFGFEGLLMLVSGGNSVCFSLNMFLVNSGQAWDAARKFILFGMLKDADGMSIGAESEIYDTLEIGEQIGGPLEDLTGPALNNFIKFVAITSFVTSNMYDLLPYNTWHMGIVQLVVNGATITFLKFGLKKLIEGIEAFHRARKEALEYEEGSSMLRDIERREAEVEANLASERAQQADDLDLH